MTAEPASSTCPECGAPWPPGQACPDAFSQMLAWENEDPRNGAVHHLMVLCYHLQHPSLYSPDGLRYALGLLVDFTERGLSTEEVRRRSRTQVDSGRRAWKVTARPGEAGAYRRQPAWSMTAADILAGGMEQYLASVERWSRAVLADLRAAGEL